MTVTITGISIKDYAPNKNGTRVLAYFDAETRGFCLIGCALVRTAKNGLTVWPPKLEDKVSGRRAILIKEDPLRHQLMEAARTAYKSLGGTEAEWNAERRTSPVD